MQICWNRDASVECMCKSVYAVKQDHAIVSHIPDVCAFRMCRCDSECQSNENANKNESRTSFSIALFCPLPCLAPGECMCTFCIFFDFICTSFSLHQSVYMCQPTENSILVQVCAVYRIDFLKLYIIIALKKHQQQLLNIVGSGSENKYS